jgi:energy-coupling factor transporter ATP-binding protein EcfA2
MIAVPRSKVEDLPEKIQAFLKEQASVAEEFFSRPLKERGQERFPFPDLDKHYDLKELLVSEFNGKCAYSESYIDPKTCTITRHRPSSEAIDSDGKVSRDHYWWLAYTWSNLIPVRREIARSKGLHFPTNRGRVMNTDRFDGLGSIESPILPNPSEPSLGSQFRFRPTVEKDGSLMSTFDFQDKIIQILGLNLFDLCKERRAAIAQIERLPPIEIKTISIYLQSLGLEKDFLQFRCQTFIRRFSTFLKKNPKKERSAISKDFGDYIRSNLPKEHPLLSFRDFWTLETSDVVPPETTPPIEPASSEPQKNTLKPLTLTHLHIHNFKGIYSLKINFPQKEHLEEGEPPFGLMVLGENGSGKSTILQAIALVLEDPKKVHDNPFLKIKKILRRGTKDGFVRLSILDHPEPLEVRFAAGQRKCRFSGPRESLRFFFRAYGAHRLLPRHNDDSPLPEKPDPIAINNLWDPYESLIDAEKWILAQKKAFFDLFALALKDLLSLGNDGRIYRDKKQLRFDIGQRYLSLDELSAGYQSVIATATDIIAGYPIRGIDMQNASGVVLIDEIGAHLHPSWRMRIVNAYRRTFPKIQFISTTHEPLCLRGVRQEELLVLEKKNSTIRPIENLPELESLRVDQILTSPIFGLNTTIDPEVEEKFQEYYALLRKDKPSKKNKERIDELRNHLYRYGVLGSSRRARAIYDIIDKNLSIGSLDGKGFEISDKTRKLVRDLWTNSDLEDLK